MNPVKQISNKTELANNYKKFDAKFLIGSFEVTLGTETLRAIVNSLPDSKEFIELYFVRS